MRLGLKIKNTRKEAKLKIVQLYLFILLSFIFHEKQNFELDFNLLSYNLILIRILMFSPIGKALTRMTTKKEDTDFTVEPSIEFWNYIPLIFHRSSQ